MIRYIDKTMVKVGDRNYTYNKDEEGNDFLSINEKIDNKDIKIILKGSTQKTIKDVEQLVMNVLGDQYIQRNLEKLV